MTRLSIVLDGLAQRKLPSFDPFHQVPRASVGFSNLLDLCIEEFALRSSSSFAEGAPVLGCLIIPVLEEGLRACVIPRGSDRRVIRFSVALSDQALEKTSATRSLLSPTDSYRTPTDSIGVL